MYIKQVYFVLSKEEDHILTLFPFFRHFVPKDQNKVCAQDKNNAEFWVQINWFNVFAMNALGSVHEKLDSRIGVAP